MSVFFTDHVLIMTTPGKTILDDHLRGGLRDCGRGVPDHHVTKPQLMLADDLFPKLASFDPRRISDMFYCFVIWACVIQIVRSHQALD